jgi:hypothetical protein
MHLFQQLKVNGIFFKAAIYKPKRVVTTNISYQTQPVMYMSIKYLRKEEFSFVIFYNM